MTVLVLWQDFRMIKKLHAGISKIFIFWLFSAGQILKISKKRQILTFGLPKMTEKLKFLKSSHATFLLS